MKSKGLAKKKTWILFGNAGGVVIPFRLQIHRKFVRVVMRNVSLKMSPATPLNVAGRVILIHSSD